MVQKTFKSVDFEKTDVSWVIPHQVSEKAVTAYHEYGGFDKNRVINILDKTGNCVAASMPMAFVTAVDDGRINRGDLLYFIGTGAGLSMACGLVSY